MAGTGLARGGLLALTQTMLTKAGLRAKSPRAAPTDAARARRGDAPVMTSRTMSASCETVHPSLQCAINNLFARDEKSKQST